MNKIQFICIFAGFTAAVLAGLFLHSTISEAKKTSKVEAKVIIKKGSSVFINENKITTANSLIASGSKLKTTKKNIAMVIIDGVGNLQLEKETSVIVNYDEQESNVYVESGCATLWVEPGKNGYLKARDEEKAIENNKRKNSIEICSDKRIGGVLLWSALGTGSGTTILGGEILLNGNVVIEPQVASASRVADLK